LSISSTTIFRIRGNLGFNFLPPIAAFSLNITHIGRRLQFAQCTLIEGTDRAKPFLQMKIHSYSVTGDGSGSAAVKLALK
jgi:hypothetical protein